MNNNNDCQSPFFDPNKSVFNLVESSSSASQGHQNGYSIRLETTVPFNKLGPPATGFDIVEQEVDLDEEPPLTVITPFTRKPEFTDSGLNSNSNSLQRTTMEKGIKSKWEEDDTPTIKPDHGRNSNTTSRPRSRSESSDDSRHYSRKRSRSPSSPRYHYNQEEDQSNKRKPPPPPNISNNGSYSRGREKTRGYNGGGRGRGYTPRGSRGYNNKGSYQYRGGRGNKSSFNNYNYKAHPRNYSARDDSRSRSGSRNRSLSRERDRSCRSLSVDAWPCNQGPPRNEHLPSLPLPNGENNEVQSSNSSLKKPVISQQVKDILHAIFRRTADEGIGSEERNKVLAAFFDGSLKLADLISQSDYSNKNRAFKELQEELSELKGKLETFESEKKMLTDNLEKIKEELQVTQKNRDSLQVLLRQTEATHQRTKQELLDSLEANKKEMESIAADLATTRGEVEATKGSNEVLQESLKKRDESVAQQLGEIAQLNAKAQIDSRILNELREKLKLCEQSRMHYKAKGERIKMEYDHLKGENDSLKGEFSNVKGEITRLKEETESLKGEINNLKGQLTTFNEEASGKDKKIRSIEDENAFLRAQLAEKISSAETRLIEQIQNGNYDLEEPVRARLSKILQLNQDLRRQLEDKNRQLKDKELELKDKNSELKEQAKKVVHAVCSVLEVDATKHQEQRTKDDFTKASLVNLKSGLKQGPDPVELATQRTLHTVIKETLRSFNMDQQKTKKQAEDLDNEKVVKKQKIDHEEQHDDLVEAGRSTPLVKRPCSPIHAAPEAEATVVQSFPSPKITDCDSTTHQQVPTIETKFAIKEVSSAALPAVAENKENISTPVEGEIKEASSSMSTTIKIDVTNETSSASEKEDPEAELIKNNQDDEIQIVFEGNLKPQVQTPKVKPEFDSGGDKDNDKISLQPQPLEELQMKTAKANNNNTSTPRQNSSLTKANAPLMTPPPTPQPPPRRASNSPNILPKAQKSAKGSVSPKCGASPKESNNAKKCASNVPTTTVPAPKSALSAQAQFKKTAAASTASKLVGQVLPQPKIYPALSLQVPESVAPSPAIQVQQNPFVNNPQKKSTTTTTRPRRVVTINHTNNNKTNPQSQPKICFQPNVSPCRWCKLSFPEEELPTHIRSCPKFLDPRSQGRKRGGKQ